MIEPWLLILAGLAGVVLGLIHFGGLWWTIRALPTAHNPAVLTLGSLLVRMAIVLGGFYVVMHGRWERLLACLLGFVLVRVVLVARVRAEREGESP